MLAQEASLTHESELRRRTVRDLNLHVLGNRGDEFFFNFLHEFSKF